MTNQNEKSVSSSLQTKLEIAKEALKPFANWDWSNGSPMPSKFWDKAAEAAKQALEKLEDKCAS